MIIYITTNMINGKMYIGKDVKNNPNYIGSGSVLKTAIKKYGRHNFKKVIIETCKTEDELKIREEYWLNFYDVGNNPMFYNLHNYSTGSPSGTRHPNYGRPLSKITREKLRNANIGKVLSTETRNKMSSSRIGDKNPMFGKTHSIESKLKLRESNLGDKNPMFGKKHSSSTRIKMGRVGELNSQFKGKLICIKGDYCGEIKTMKEWSVLLNRQLGHFSQHLNGKCYKNGINGNFFKRIVDDINAIQ